MAELIEVIRKVICEELDKRFPIKNTLTTEEKAAQLGIKPETLRRKARNGEIPCTKSGTGSKARYVFLLQILV